MEKNLKNTLPVHKDIIKKLLYITVKFIFCYISLLTLNIENSHLIILKDATDFCSTCKSSLDKQKYPIMQFIGRGESIQRLVRDHKVRKRKERIRAVRGKSKLRRIELATACHGHITTTRVGKKIDKFNTVLIM